MAQNKSRTSSKQQTIIMLLVGGGLILVALAAFLAIPSAQAEVESARETIYAVPISTNYPAPRFSLTDLDGNPVSFEDYRGQVILYNAWATWCPPCKAEMPVLQGYYDDHKDKGFVVIAIEDGQPVEEVRAFVKEYGLTFPVWPDLKWVATESFKTNALPSSFVIDRQGNVRLAWRGEINRENLEKYVTPLLEE